MNNTVSLNDLDAAQTKTLKDGIKEISVHLSRMDSEKEAIKDIVNSIYDEIKVPKKIINRMSKVYHKQSFFETVTEDKEFKELYEKVVGSN